MSRDLSEGVVLAHNLPESKINMRTNEDYWRVHPFQMGKCMSLLQMDDHSDAYRRRENSYSLASTPAMLDEEWLARHHQPGKPRDA